MLRTLLRREKYEETMSDEQPPIKNAHLGSKDAPAFSIYFSNVLYIIRLLKSVSLLLLIRQACY